MSETITLFDSRPYQPYRGTNPQGLVQAVARLNRDFREDRVDLLSLSGRARGRGRERPEIITPEFDERRVGGEGGTAPLTLSVSYYVGTYSTRVGADAMTIQIKPRWGADWLGYLLRYTTGIYLPPDAAAANTPQRDSAEWLLVLLWRSLFQQALRRFHLPREYRAQPINERFFRGRLDVARHIRVNLADGSRFACVHRPLTPDILINRTIRFVLKKLAASPYGSLIGDLYAQGERLAGFGVRQPERVTPAELDRIRYSKLNEGYRPLMQASRALIQRFGSEVGGKSEPGPSFLVDMAELWENYLQAILNERLPSEYRVYSPNDVGGVWLIEGERRKIRPDLIIEKDGQAVAVLDAKFKGYTKIGTKEEPGSVSRGDLYQMATYLYHYGRVGQRICGLFVCPSEDEGQVEEDKKVGGLVSNREHRIGVVNFGLPRGDAVGRPSFDLSAVREAERKFTDVVSGHLQGSRACSGRDATGFADTPPGANTLPGVRIQH